jgi:photosystem II stability/assembly factor-like uncharacterized protein
MIPMPSSIETVHLNRHQPSNESPTALQSCLRRGERDLARRFFKAAAKPIGAAWHCPRCQGRTPAGANQQHLRRPGVDSGRIRPRRRRKVPARHRPCRPARLPPPPCPDGPRRHRQPTPVESEDGCAHRADRAARQQPVLPPYLTDGLSVEQAAYDWYVAAPASADTVYLGAIELVKGKRTGGSWSWSDISSRQRDGDSIHPDQHTMTFDPQDPDVVYAGNDGGIFRSPDAGKTWQPLNDGLAISEVEYLTQRPDEPGWILAGLQDNGTVRREAAATWAQVALGDGGDFGTNTESPDVCFHSYYYMNLERSGHRGDPKTWTDITPPGTDPDTDGFGALFYPPVEVNGDLVVKAGEAVCISTDRGDSWRQVPLPANGGQRSIASALAIPSAQRVLVGTIRGDVFRIDRTGGGWGSATALATPRDGFISDVLAAPGSPDRYWVTISTPGRGQVFRSNDAGETWTDVTSNLPTAPVNAVISDPADPDRVWVCDVGVFESRRGRGLVRPQHRSTQRARRGSLVLRTGSHCCESAPAAAVYGR